MRSWDSPASIAYDIPRGGINGFLMPCCRAGGEEVAGDAFGDLEDVVGEGSVAPGEMPVWVLPLFFFC